MRYRFDFNSFSRTNIAAHFLGQVFIYQFITSPIIFNFNLLSLLDLFTNYLYILPRLPLISILTAFVIGPPSLKTFYFSRKYVVTFFCWWRDCPGVSLRLLKLILPFNYLPWIFRTVIFFREYVAIYCFSDELWVVIWYSYWFSLFVFPRNGYFLENILLFS